jgi:type I site-specific restriction-modification system R (restriction) subunit
MRAQDGPPQRNDPVSTARLLDLVENFTLFSEHKAGLVKILGQNHQFLGVNNAIASMLAARKLGHRRGGGGLFYFLDFN